MTIDYTNHDSTGSITGSGDLPDEVASSFLRGRADNGTVTTMRVSPQDTNVYSNLALHRIPTGGEVIVQVCQSQVFIRTTDADGNTVHFVGVELFEDGRNGAPITNKITVDTSLLYPVVGKSV